jgi:hypothetical protein
MEFTWEFPDAYNTALVTPLGTMENEASSNRVFLHMNFIHFLEP